MPKIYDAITIGGATRDIMFYTDEATVMPNPMKDATRQKLVCFEFGAKISIEGSYFTLGGGGNNAAVAFSRLGMKTATALAIGDDDNGQAVMENLKKNKVDTKFVQKIKNKKTGFSFILTLDKEKERTIFLYRGANDELKFRAPSSEIRAEWFYVSSLPGKNWQNILNKVLRRGRLAWNPGANQIKAGKKNLIKFMLRTEVLIVNKDEAIELILSDEKYQDKQADFLNQPKNLLLALKEWGPKIVVVTDGKNGAYVYDGQNINYLPVVKLGKDAVDLTGVGDAFGSSFVAGLEIYNGDIEKSLRLALVNSASVTTEIGAQNRLLTLKEAKKIISNLHENL
jgi:sugar/nucleoside kinase (ribokinase family)